MMGDRISSSMKLNLAWLVLLLLSLGGAVIGEFAQSGFWITLLIATVTAFKGWVIIDHFMELGDYKPVFRKVVRSFGLLVPVLMMITYLWGSLLANINWLGE